MLVPLTRQSIEQIVPIIATGPQYAHYWGKWSDFLRRLFISIIALTAAWLIGNLFGPGGLTIKLIFDIIAFAIIPIVVFPTGGFGAVAFSMLLSPRN